MKRPFAVQLRRYELLGGLIWLAVYLLLMSNLPQLLLRLAGISVSTLTLNKIYFLGCFLVTAVLFRRFLSYSLPAVADRPLRVLCGILLGYCVYAACQGTLSMVYGYLAPNLKTPNDDNIRAIAQSSYSTMAVAAVLLAPITEETLLRGLVFGGLREKSRVLAYGVTAVLFSGIHIMNYVLVLDLTSLMLNALLYLLPSIALCVCYEYAGTSWAPIGLHMLINALSMWVMGQGL